MCVVAGTAPSAVMHLLICLHPVLAQHVTHAWWLLFECHVALCAGILYHDMYASDLVGTHVEMRSLEVCSTSA